MTAVEVLGRCRHCGGGLRRIDNLATGKRSVVTRCGHCDEACNRPRCPTCSKMLKTVRIIPEP